MAGAGTQVFRGEPEINSFELLQGSGVSVNIAEALLCNQFKSNIRISTGGRLNPVLRCISSNSTAIVVTNVVKIFG